jgi:hypothetical protein
MSSSIKIVLGIIYLPVLLSIIHKIFEQDLKRFNNSMKLCKCYVCEYNKRKGLPFNHNDYNSK